MKRGERSARRVGTRAQRARVLIVTGGERTEFEYFKWVEKELQGATVQVELVAQGFNPEKLLQHACELRDTDLRAAKRSGDAENVFERVWVVVDVDHFEAELRRIKPLALHKGIDLVISNPCFEVWLVAHQDASMRPVTRFEAQKHAKELGVVTELNVKWINAAALQEKFEEAENIVQRHRAQHERNGTEFPHDTPSTRVDEIVRFLIDAAVAARPGFTHTL